ncbi:adenylyl-sulfate kinase [Micromonospora chokoriensis]
MLLDGDALRTAIGETASYDLDSRRRLAFRYSNLCRMVVRQGHVVICATIPFHDVRTWNHRNQPGCLEVFLDVPITELVRRESSAAAWSRGTRL